MRLPKRVPWSDISELEQIYSWIFSPEADDSTKIKAVDRLAAWKVATPLPHALESTYSLLVVILQDEAYSNSTSLRSTLVLRQSFSLALIRMVNGLVDPLQQGVYARSIASIARQIGLPVWLVDLRHASTHEELPSLELLREGAREAMSWILQNYFLPTLSPNGDGGESAKFILSPLQPILLQYKKLLKATTRDVSLQSTSKTELLRILQSFDLWISEAVVTASAITFDVQSPEDNQDEKETWALEQLSDGLIGRGGLVPVSKRKRANPSQGLDVPIPQHVALWSPLLLHICSRHPAFPSVLLFRIVGYLSTPRRTLNPPGHVNNDSTMSFDPTYDHVLASWALWIIRRWSNDPMAECDREDTIKELLLGLGRNDSQASRALLDSLTEGDDALRNSVGILSSSLRSSSTRVSVWDDNALRIMSERLASLEAQKHDEVDNFNSFSDDVEMSDGIDQPEKPAIQEVDKIRGWQLLEERHGWKPCPIGVYKRVWP